VNRANLRPIRLAVAILTIGFCLFFIQVTARIGFSRLLSRYALISNSIPAVEQAIRLRPSDPDAHRARAAVFNRLRMPTEATKSLETAVSLRYRDDYLWLELGNSREELGDVDGALEAFDQAVRWAPYYAHPRWQRGNLLLRTNRPSEAFAELRQAAAANRNYVPNLIDLVWGFSREEINVAEQLLEINGDSERSALIRFLARKGKGKEVLDQLRLLSAPLSSSEKNELSRRLFSAKVFREAFELRAGADSLRLPVLFNSGFEEPPVLSHAGFGGWVLSREQTKSKMAIDVAEKFAGKSSLQITFEGDWNPGIWLLAQTFLVEPGRTYRISFNIKTKDLVTGGPPVFIVSDAVSDQLLGQSDNFSWVTTEWRGSSFEFNSLATSEAAVIRLRRNTCEPSPCPIFGSLWLDEISIEQIK
jgi:tetratricopeptide (TPR) repeat protein